MIEAFLKSEKERALNLFSAKHRIGFRSKEDFVKWYLEKLAAQNYCCYYCETSIFTIRELIEKEKLKARRTGYGSRGPVLEIDKKVNSEGYNRDNCVLSCYYCNNDKSSIFNGDEYKTHFGANRKKHFHYLKDSLEKAAER